MATTILSLISGIAAVIGGYFAIKTNPNRLRKQAEKEVRRKEIETNASKQEIREAVYGRDDDKVNRLVNRLLTALAVSSVIVVGCITVPQTVYIPTDRRIESCTNSYGIACKAVPDAVFVELLEKVQELKNIKTEQAIDKRLAK